MVTPTRNRIIQSVGCLSAGIKTVPHEQKAAEIAKGRRRRILRVLRDLLLTPLPCHLLSLCAADRPPLPFLPAILRDLERLS